MKQISVFDEYVTITIKKPTRCGECPFYSERGYECHNDRGYEAHCAMGYMKCDDTRDIAYRKSVYPNCKLGKEE